MNATLRTSVVVSSVLFATTFLAGLLSAAPLRFQIDLLAGSGTSPTNALRGAALQLNITWDAAELPPLPPFGEVDTRWAIGSTAASLTVTGSATADGVYEASFPTSPFPPHWVATSQPQIDGLTVPQMRFEINGTSHQTSPLFVFFDSSFFNDPRPYVPKAFDNEDVLYWGTLDITRRTGPGSSVVATVVSGSATTVPEPASMALAGTSILSLAALRRRK